MSQTVVGQGNLTAPSSVDASESSMIFLIRVRNQHRRRRKSTAAGCRVGWRCAWVEEISWLGAQPFERSLFYYDMLSQPAIPREYTHTCSHTKPCTDTANTTGMYRSMRPPSGFEGGEARSVHPPFCYEEFRGGWSCLDMHCARAVLI